MLWVIFMGFFLPFLGEGTLGNSMGPLAAISFGLLGIYAVAMFLALKWERAAVPVAVGVAREHGARDVPGDAHDHFVTGPVFREVRARV